MKSSLVLIKRNQALSSKLVLKEKTNYSSTKHDEAKFLFMVKSSYYAEIIKLENFNKNPSKSPIQVKVIGVPSGLSERG